MISRFVFMPYYEMIGQFFRFYILHECLYLQSSMHSHGETAGTSQSANSTPDL